MKTSLSPLAAGFAVFMIIRSLTADSALAQVSFSEAGMLSDAQNASPFTGPGSAHSNPAALSEAKLAYVQSGAHQTMAGKSGRNFFQGAVTLPPGILPGFPIRVSAGYRGAWSNSGIDNSNAIYRNSLAAPSLALAWPRATDQRYSLALGAAFPQHFFDAFGAVESNSGSMDLGLLASLAAGGHGFRLGFSYRNLVEPEVELPDNRGAYSLPGWMELSLDWTSPKNRFQVHWEQFISESDDMTEGPGSNRDQIGVNNWGFEYRPIAWLGLKAERPRLGSQSTLGLVFRPVIRPWFWKLPIETYLEANYGHEQFDPPLPQSFKDILFGDLQDEGRGSLFGLTVGLGI